LIRRMTQTNRIMLPHQFPLFQCQQVSILLAFIVERKTLLNIIFEGKRKPQL
jgi:ascorbate-specific PTS system EIIC-type component UlaA